MRFAILLFLLVSGGSAAEGLVTRSDYMEVCRLKSSLSSLIMERRQKGASMADAMDAAGDDSYHQTIVHIAYQLPIQPTEDLRQIAASEFSNRVFSACFEQIPSDAR